MVVLIVYLSLGLLMVPVCLEVWGNGASPKVVVGQLREEWGFLLQQETKGKLWKVPAAISIVVWQLLWPIIVFDFIRKGNPKSKEEFREEMRTKRSVRRL